MTVSELAVEAAIGVAALAGAAAASVALLLARTPREPKTSFEEGEPRIVRTMDLEGMLRSAFLEGRTSRSGRDRPGSSDYAAWLSSRTRAALNLDIDA